jgi:hypothetical protein
MPLIEDGIIMVECCRCCYEYNLNDLVVVEDAFYCQDCEDTHEGLVCNDCLTESEKKKHMERNDF